MIQLENYNSGHIERGARVAITILYPLVLMVILKEMTGQTRNRVFVFDNYVNLF